MSLRFLLCFFAASVAGTTGLGQRMSLAEGVKAAVMRSDEIRVYALLSSDLNSLDDLLTSDCIYVHSSGRAQTKPELLAALKSGALSRRPPSTCCKPSAGNWRHITRRASSRRLQLCRSPGRIAERARRLTRRRAAVWFPAPCPSLLHLPTPSGAG